MKLGRIILGAIIAAGCIFGSTGCNNAVLSSKGNADGFNVVAGDTIAEINIEGYGTIKAKLFPEIAPNAVQNFTMLAGQGYYDGLKIHRVLTDNFVQGGSLNGDGSGGTALINEDGKFDIETSADARHYYGALSYANTLGNNTTQFFIVTNNAPFDITTLDTEQIKAAADTYTELKSHLTETDAEYTTYSYKEKYYTNLAGMVTGATEAVTKDYSEKGGMPMFDGGYTVFGQVYEGFDVLEALNSCEVTSNAFSEKSKPVKEIIITSVVVTKYVEPGTGEAAEPTAEASKPESSAEAAPSTAEASAIVDDNSASSAA